MGGLPVTIRLLDPPLHEFLPQGDDEIAEVAKAMGTEPKKLEGRADELPNSTRCSASAAAASPSPIRRSPRCRRAPSSRRRSRPAETGKPVVPEMMVPLIATKAEFDLVKARIDAMAEAVAKETGSSSNYQVGTMIELPRACAARRRDRRGRRNSSRSAPTT